MVNRQYNCQQTIQWSTDNTMVNRHGTKGKSEVIHRKTDNTMINRQYNGQQTIQ